MGKYIDHSPDDSQVFVSCGYDTLNARLGNCTTPRRIARTSRGRYEIGTGQLQFEPRAATWYLWIII